MLLAEFLSLDQYALRRDAPSTVAPVPRRIQCP